MEVNSTEVSSSSQGGTGWLDLTLVTCTETVTFTEVVAEEEWGSFYYSFKTEQLVTLWILFIVTIAGNAIVLISTWRRKRKSRMTYFVTQLAITAILPPPLVYLLYLCLNWEDKGLHCPIINVHFCK